MECKYCGKELEGELEVCPECEKEQALLTETEAKETVKEEAETKKDSESKEKAKPKKETKAKEETEEEEKPKPKEKAPKAEVSVSFSKIVLATVVMVLLVFVLVGALIYGITGKLPYDFNLAASTNPDLLVTLPADPTTATSAPRTAEELGLTIEGITDRQLYAADEDAVLAAADEVVATVGDYSITNRQLQVFYWRSYSEFVAEVSESGYDLVTTYNLDVTKPFAEQLVVNSVVTWEQLFLHYALDNFWRYAILNTMADEAGYELTAEEQEYIASIPEQLEADAKEAGFESAEAMLKDRVGPSCTMEAFTFYISFVTRGDQYATKFQSEYTPTLEEVEEFYALNAEYYQYYGITKDTPKTVSVRHVLLVPEGATTDSSTGYVTATEEQWAAGETAAKAMLDAWVAEGAAEEDFAAMANEHSTDGGSNTNGGLYENVVYGTMVETFNTWIFDESRQPGDYGIVKTDFGYHLMYFVSRAEEETWIAQATADCISSGYCISVKLEEAQKTQLLDAVLDKMILTDLKQEAQSETATTETAATE